MKVLVRTSVSSSPVGCGAAGVARVSALGSGRLAKSVAAAAARALPPGDDCFAGGCSWPSAGPSPNALGAIAAAAVVQRASARHAAPCRSPAPERRGCLAGRGARAAAAASQAQGGEAAVAHLGTRTPPLLLALAVLCAAGRLDGDLVGGASIAVCATLGALLGQRTAVGRALSGPVCAMATGVVAAQVFAVTPRTLRRLQQLVLALATPLLLLSCNLEEVLGRRTRRLLAAFALGSLGSFLGGLLGVALLREPLTVALGGWPEASALASALTAKNIGSGLNFLAVVEALRVPPVLVAAALAGDNLLGLLYFPLASGLMPAATSPPAAEREKGQESAGPGEDSGRSGRAGTVWRSAISTLLLASAIAAVSKALAPPGLVQIAATMLAVVVATASSTRIWHGDVARSGDSLGQPLLFLYFASAGFAAGRLTPGSLLAYAPLLLFGLVLYAVHMAVLLGGGRLLRLERAELLVASNANIGGPATASSMALAKGFPGLARPSLLVGMLGNAAGTALGLGLHCLLRVGGGPR